MLVNHSVTANGVQHLADALAIQALKSAPTKGFVIVQRLKAVPRANPARRDLECRPEILPGRKEPAQIVFRLNLRVVQREGHSLDPRRLA